jgi:CRP-like cAMP-binding protein
MNIHRLSAAEFGPPETSRIVRSAITPCASAAKRRAFSQETLAEMIGTSRSRVSFFMNKFRKSGFIEYNGKIEVHNSFLNVILYDKPEIKARDANK